MLGHLVPGLDTGADKESAVDFTALYLLYTKKKLAEKKPELVGHNCSKLDAEFLEVKDTAFWKD